MEEEEMLVGHEFEVDFDIGMLGGILEYILFE